MDYFIGNFRHSAEFIVDNNKFTRIVEEALKWAQHFNHHLLRTQVLESGALLQDSSEIYYIIIKPTHQTKQL